MKLRIGHGYDVHAFGEGAQIVLGGVYIPHKKTLIAHSDGDVVLHALCDALLGALALGDIGRHFPDSDPQYKNADSKILLQNVYKKVTHVGFYLNNADITIIAQQPKMAPHIDLMRKNIADVLSVAIEQINVKATTTEGLGFAGREEGIAVHAVVLLAG
ncbi:MAG: 2-C-methyl-D-erythritol 2,4-cyclodiphosphate synthase [Gammaproteobacteria bacterium]|nr:2-C-methyl-D-erythritol 2,4-cyclodiphosphate synthase [Gammaproteobacteria bacterium]